MTTQLQESVFFSNAPSIMARDSRRSVLPMGDGELPSRLKTALKVRIICCPHIDTLSEPPSKAVISFEKYGSRDATDNIQLSQGDPRSQSGFRAGKRNT